jgi:uncharacterized protein
MHAAVFFLSRHSYTRFVNLLWVVPPTLVAGFLLAVNVLPRAQKIEAYRFFFTEVFWLSVPYAVAALVSLVIAFRARRWWLALGSASALLLAVSATYARFIEPEQIVIRETTLHAGAPLRVALIADLHIGLFQGRARVQQLVDKLNGLDIDVVLVAGDWTYEPREPLIELLAPLAQSRHRMLSVPGNHDEEMPGPPLAAELRAALIAHRVEPIEGKIVNVKGVNFVGVGDRWARKDWVATLTGDDGPFVALAHNPDSIDRLAGTRIRTLLAGHTHGGQINLPFATARVLRNATKGGFKRGLYPIGERQVFITSGLGTVGLPLRLFQPPVIDVLTLH